MSLRFKVGKTTKLRDEFKAMNPRLQVLALSMAAFCDFHFGKDIVVTQIFRTKEQQLSYYPNRKYRPSVHQFGRGIDFGVRPYGTEELDPGPGNCQLPHHPGFTEGEIAALDEWYSKAVQYDDERPEYDSTIYHDIGLGKHLHIQVSWRNTTRLRSNVPSIQMLLQRFGLIK